jgi:hypothetical protein
LYPALTLANGVHRGTPIFVYRSEMANTCTAEQAHDNSYRCIS